MEDMRHMRAGFTLIELLIVVTISIMMLGGSIAAYSKLNTRQTLTVGAREFISSLYEARQDAASGLKPTSGCTQLNGITIYIPQNNPTIYSLNYNCSNGKIWMKQVNLPSGVRFNINADQWLTFYGQTGGADSMNAFQLTFSSLTYLVTVNLSGDISDGGIQ